MASISVPQNTCEIDQGWDVDWEERIYGESCAWARQQAEAYIEELDEALYEARAGDWRVLGFRRRVLVTRFGEVEVRRRLYQDDHGGGCFLLDEHLGLPEQ